MLIDHSLVNERTPLELELELALKYKVVVHSCPILHYPSHPWIFRTTRLLTMANGNVSVSAPMTTWSSFLSQIFETDRRPINGSYEFRAIEKKAREVTKEYHCAYLLHADLKYN